MLRTHNIKKSCVLNVKKKFENVFMENKFSGERGIRTPGKEFSPYDGLANRWFQPLTHLSKKGALR